jgi:hypothetical protein
MNTAARKGFKSFASNFGFNKIYKAISRQRIATLIDARVGSRCGFGIFGGQKERLTAK